MLPSWSECRPVGGHSPMRLLRQSHGLVVPDVAAKGSPARARHPRLAGAPSICYCIARLSRCGSSGGNWNQPWRRLSRPPELQVFGASRPGARATVENLARHLTVIYRRCGPFRPGFCEDKGNPGWRGCRTSRSKIALPSMLWPLNCRDDILNGGCVARQAPLQGTCDRNQWETGGLPRFRSTLAEPVSFSDPIDEHAQAWRKLTRVRIEDVHWQWRRRKVR